MESSKVFCGKGQTVLKASRQSSHDRRRNTGVVRMFAGLLSLDGDVLSRAEMFPSPPKKRNTAFQRRTRWRPCRESAGRLSGSGGIF